MRYRIEPLAAGHDRRGFASGSEPLDRYFQVQVGQDVRRRVAACYVAIDLELSAIAGYYALSAGSVPLAEGPGALSRRLPRYRAVPVALLGRLAVHRNWQGQKLGAALLWDAILRATRSEVAMFALVVDAKDDQAAAFYRHQGFIAIDSLSQRLVLPLTDRTLVNNPPSH